MKKTRIQVPTSMPTFTMRQWLRMALAAAIIATFGWLYLLHIGSLVPLAPSEHAQLQQDTQLQSILNNPLNLGYKLIAAASWHLWSTPAGLRLPSVLFAAISIATFFFLCRKWYGTHVAAAGGVLFASSTWVLQTGRFATAYSSLLCIVVLLLAAAAWLRSAPGGKSAAAFIGAVAAACLVPGGIWFAIGVSLALHASLAQAFKQRSKQTIPLASGVLALTAAVLAVSFVRHPELIKIWLGLPATLPSVLEFGKQILMSASFILARGPVKPELWLGHTPLLDVASGVLFLVGCILFGRNIRSQRSLVLMAVGIPAIVLVGLHGASGLTFLVPVVYLIITGGIALLWREWRSVFPRNPMARIAGITIAVVLIACIARFHTIRYFIAWRNNPDTVQAYRQQLPPVVDNLIQ